jgi:hypothetical protein
MSKRRSALEQVASSSLAVTLFLASSVVCAEDWVVRKNQGNMNCYVQRATSLAAPAQQVLERAPGRKEACLAAKKLFVEDDQQGKCPAYTLNTMNECNSEGVNLK